MTDALAGIKVVDFSRQMSAPYATVLLGDFGADVVKIESMPHGDATRRTGTAFIDGESGLFLMWNRNKRSVAVDMRKPESKEILRRLITKSDVLMENFRPGVAEDIGIGYEHVSKINPKLVYCSVTAFGSKGPLAQFPGTDPVVQAMSGVMSVTGEADGGPVLVGVPVADFATAMVAVQAVLLGLMARDRTGRGQRADVAMLSSLVFSLTTRLASYWADGKDPQRQGSAHSVVAPYQVYKTVDGQIMAGAWQPESWPRFCVAVGRQDLETDQRFAKGPDRVKNRDELNAILKPLFEKKTTAEWEHCFHEANALCSPVSTISEIINHPQLAALGMVTSVKHPKAGVIPQLNPPIQLSETPGAVKRAPPMFGQHTREVLIELEYTESEVGSLAKSGVVHIPDLRG